MENPLQLLVTRKIRETKRPFDSISFNDVFRELNDIVDKLSKEALLLHEDSIVTIASNEGGSLHVETTFIF